MSSFSYGDDRLEKIFDEQVPSSGKSDNLLGEIVRAWMRVCYRWMNDGDQIGVGYGKETCNSAARFLASKIPDLRYLQNFTDREDNGYEIPDEEYEERLCTITKAVRAYVDAHYVELSKMPTEDYQEVFYKEEYDEERWEEEEYEEEEEYNEEDYE